MIDPTLKYKPKRSIGYGVSFVAPSVRPVTGHEWVFRDNTTPEQWKVIEAIERLFATMRGQKYIYAFTEVHRDDFDGYALRIRNRENGTSLRKLYDGFPKSCGTVVEQLHDLYVEMSEAEAESD